MTGSEQRTDPTGYATRATPFRRPPELDGMRTVHPVVIVGGGLTGLTLAIDLCTRGVPVVVIEQNDSIAVHGLASRGIAYAKRTLEIFDRLGVARRVAEAGVTWSRGRVYDGLDEIYHFDVQPDTSQKWPAFVNLQQLYVEEILVDRLEELAGADVRWRSRVAGVEQHDSGVRLSVETPEGPYALEAGWVVACDGAGSPLRDALGIAPPVALFEDTWCIVDVKVDRTLTERHFWLNSPLVNGGVVIMHQMACGIMRTDWQISRLPEPDLEAMPERATARLASLLGEDVDFELVSLSRWRFRTRVMDSFVHGRVVFAGDAAHEIPPFGARGGNSGMQDADNLGWKLATVVQGHATPALLSTYDLERVAAARENARLAGESAAFITPQSQAARLVRDAVISLAHDHAWARPLVNTGRLSTASGYAASTLSLPERDGHGFAAGVAPGESAVDGPVESGDGHGYLLEQLRGRFTALWFVDGDAPWPRAAALPREVRGLALDHVVVAREAVEAPRDAVVLVDREGRLFERYDAAGGACYLLRPDGHVAGRGRKLDPATPREMMAAALAQADPEAAARRA